MMDLSEAYKVIEGYPPGTMAAIPVEEGRVLATSQTAEEMLEKLGGWDNAKPPLIVKVPDFEAAWLL